MKLEDCKTLEDTMQFMREISKDHPALAGLVEDIGRLNDLLLQVTAESEANYKAADAWQELAIDFQAQVLEAECKLIDVREYANNLPDGKIKGDLLCLLQTESPGSEPVQESPFPLQTQTPESSTSLT